MKVRAGEYYSPGAGEAVVMGDTRVLRVRMDVEERDIGKIRKGLYAYITADAFPGQRFPGRVIENAATARSGEPMDDRERRELERAAAAFYGD